MGMGIELVFWRKNCFSRQSLIVFNCAVCKERSML